MIETYDINLEEITGIIVENVTRLIQWLNHTQIIFAEGTSNEISVSYWVVILAFFVIDVVVYILLSGSEVKK